MAQEFLDWNKEITKDEIQKARDRFLHKDSVATVSEWKYSYETLYSQKLIRHAVYEADDAREWQSVRVAMKGLTTQEKLVMMATYLKAAKLGHLNCSAEIGTIRVHNYIGALRRGGQLDADMQIRK